LYWLGNAAKTEVISRILESAKGRDHALIFDYGCGTGGDWPSILRDFPQIELVAYDPNQQSINKARERLKGSRATVLTGSSIVDLDISADFIVSFSVFEHVHDRKNYLQTAKRLLAHDGTFYLNYDDGHFRATIDLDRPVTWLPAMSTFSHNLLSPFLARLGRISQFQRRVPREEADRLVDEVERECREDFYSNLAGLKSLFKSIPENGRRITVGCG
jgi:SAM-dependent methyltransferase